MRGGVIAGPGFQAEAGTSSETGGSALFARRKGCLEGVVRARSEPRSMRDHGFELLTTAPESVALAAPTLSVSLEGVSEVTVAAMASSSAREGASEVTVAASPESALKGAPEDSTPATAAVVAAPVAVVVAAGAIVSTDLATASSAGPLRIGSRDQTRSRRNFDSHRTHGAISKRPRLTHALTNVSKRSRSPWPAETRRGGVTRTLILNFGITTASSLFLTWTE